MAEREDRSRKSAHPSPTTATPITTVAERAEIELLERRVACLTERERRLVRLYSFDDVDEALIREGVAEGRREKSVLEERLRAVRPAATPTRGAIDDRLLASAWRQVYCWLDQAGEAERQRALEALQIAVTATRKEATVSGVIPLEAPEFLIPQRASA